MDKDQFLSDFQKIAKINGVRFWIKRLDNTSMMEILGLTESMVTEEVLLKLTADDFVKGPIHKDGYPDAWWFRQNIKGYEVYIKLSIVEKGKRKRAECISFHQDSPWTPHA